MRLVQICFCFTALALAWAQEEVLLDIPQGTLRGLKTTTVYHGVPYYSFKGIPYAKPVTGSDKFKDSEPAEGWSGVRDATQHGNVCIFYCLIRQQVFGHEDCLYLNVYTPDLNKDAGKATIVYIHGGGFNTGDGNDDLYGPDFLIEKDVIIVTINYRLGVIGFLNTGDEIAPGNMGLKDQVLALKWVRDNIKNFGGDPGRITLVGNSAGSAAITYHMLSPMAIGLFQRVILGSGTFASSWAIQLYPKEDAMLLGEKFGIKSTDTVGLAAKLREIPAFDLVAASGALDMTEAFIGGNYNTFLPSVEYDFGQEMYLSDCPWELIKNYSAKIADVDTMIGVLSHEGGVIFQVVLSMTPVFQDHFDLFVPKDLRYITTPEQRKEIGDSIKKFYFNNEPISEANHDALVDLRGDILIIHGAALNAKQMNSRFKSPVYEYLVTFDSPTYVKTMIGFDKGAVHTDENTYLFYSNIFKNKPEPGSRVEKTVDAMVEMWTDFVKEGNPSVTKKAAKVEWKPMGDSDNYLEIGDNIELKTSMYKERVNFWASLYKDFLGDYIKLFN